MAKLNRFDKIMLFNLFLQDIEEKSIYDDMNFNRRVNCKVWFDSFEYYIHSDYMFPLKRIGDSLNLKYEFEIINEKVN